MVNVCASILIFFKAYPVNQMPVTSRNVGDKVFARHTKSGKYLPGTIIEPTKGVKIDKESYHIVYFQTFKKIVTKDIKDFDEAEINSFITAGNNLLALQQAMDDDFPLEHAIEHPEMYKGEPKKRKSKTKNANNKKPKTSKDSIASKSEIEEITLMVADEEPNLTSTPKKINKSSKANKSPVKKTPAKDAVKKPSVKKTPAKTPKKTPSKKVVDSVIESDKVVLDDEAAKNDEVKQSEKTPTRATTPKSVKQTVADISQSLNITPSPSKLSLASEQSYDESVFSDASTNLSTIFVNSKPKQWVDVLDYMSLWN